VAELRFKFINIEAESQEHAGRPVYAVNSNRSGEAMAQIFWHAPWRMWCVRFNPDTVWSEDCLRDVRLAIDHLTTKHS
jgi:hypothetical protein